MIIVIDNQLIHLEITDGILVSGWISIQRPEDKKRRFFLSTLRHGEVELEISVNRSDILASGHSLELCCGFTLDGLQPCIRLGDFVNIRINTLGSDFSKTFLLNENRNLADEFNSLELEPGRSIVDTDLKNLIFQYSDVFLLKVILIRLRRGIRGESDKYPFIGYSYNQFYEDYKVFSYMIEKFGEVLSKEFRHHTRWLFSINDTFSDCGEAKLQDVSHSFSVIMVLERFFQTYRLHRSEQLTWDPEYSHTQISYWGAMRTNKLDLDDVYDIFLTRLINQASTSRSWVHLQLLLNILEESTSLVGTLIEASDYFSPRLPEYLELVEHNLRLLWDKTGSTPIEKKL